MDAFTTTNFDAPNPVDLVLWPIYNRSGQILKMVELPLTSSYDSRLDHPGSNDTQIAWPYMNDDDSVIYRVYDRKTVKKKLLTTLLEHSGATFRYQSLRFLLDSRGATDDIVFERVRTLLHKSPSALGSADLVMRVFRRLKKLDDAAVGAINRGNFGKYIKRDEEAAMHNMRVGLDAIITSGECCMRMKE